MTAVSRPQRLTAERQALRFERESERLLLAGKTLEACAHLRDCFASWQQAAARYAEGMESAPRAEVSRARALLRRLNAALRRGRRADLLVWRAAVKRRLLDYPGAVADLDAAEALAPLSAAALTWRGEARLQIFDRDRGLADLEAALSKPDAAAWNWAWRGRVLITLQHELEESFRCLDRSVELAPDWALARAWRGEARRRKGDLAGALEDFEAARAGGLLPEDLLLLRGWRALAQLDHGRPREARAELRALLRSMPRHDLWWLGLSQASHALGDASGWIIALDRAAALSSKHSQEPRRWGRERLNAAISMLARAGRKPAVLRWRGFLQMLAGAPDRGLVELEAACRLDPRRALNWLWRAEALASLGRLGEAALCCARALKLQARCVEALLLKARLAALAGDRRAALSAYDAATRADGRCTLAYAERGALRLSLGEATAAAADLERAVALDSRDPAPWVDLAQARRLAGDSAGEAQALRCARALDPKRAAERQRQWNSLAGARPK